MTRKRTSAIPNERIQLSNQRAHVERRGSGGRRAAGATRAPEPLPGAPKSCMPFTLANRPTARNSHRPAADPSPVANPRAELLGRVAMPDPRGDARGRTLALHPLPADGRARQLGERVPIERRPAPPGEHDHQRFVIHVAQYGVRPCRRRHHLVAWRNESTRPRSGTPVTLNRRGRSAPAAVFQRNPRRPPWSPSRSHRPPSRLHDARCQSASRHRTEGALPPRSSAR